MIRLPARAVGPRFERLATVGVPAWVISSFVHALVFAILIGVIGSSDITVATAPGLVINTTLPDADELGLGDPIELTIADHSIDVRAAGDPAATDPAAAAGQG